MPAQKTQALSDLITSFPTLGHAYRLKELFNDLWEMGSEEEAIAFLVDWCEEVDKSGIEPFKKFSNTIKTHWQGINSKIQPAKRRARGYRCVKNFINMIYFLCGKLTFDFPSYPLKTS